MPFETLAIDQYENRTDQRDVLNGMIMVEPGARIFRATFEGPLSVLRNCQLGPDIRVGKYSGFNRDCFFARGTIGSFCSIGARVSINPFNHPIDWLSVNEFQYHPISFNWVDEYNQIERLERTPDMFEPVTIGHDVWIGHHANILPGVTIGTGAVIGAGTVVTKDVPPYAIAVGVPGKVIRYRFDQEIVARLLAVRWWEFELPELSGLPYRDIVLCLERLEALRVERDRR